MQWDHLPWWNLLVLEPGSVQQWWQTHAQVAARKMKVLSCSVTFFPFCGLSVLKCKYASKEKQLYQNWSDIFPAFFFFLKNVKVESKRWTLGEGCFPSCHQLISWKHVKEITDFLIYLVFTNATSFQIPKNASKRTLTWPNRRGAAMCVYWNWCLQRKVSTSNRSQH